MMEIAAHKRCRLSFRVRLYGMQWSACNNALTCSLSAASCPAAPSGRPPTYSQSEWRLLAALPCEPGPDSCEPANVKLEAIEAPGGESSAAATAGSSAPPTAGWGSIAPVSALGGDGSVAGTAAGGGGGGGGSTAENAGWTALDVSTASAAGSETGGGGAEADGPPVAGPPRYSEKDVQPSAGNVNTGSCGEPCGIQIYSCHAVVYLARGSSNKNVLPPNCNQL